MHKFNRANQAYGDAEAQMALERMRKEVANAYERIEDGDATLERAEVEFSVDLRC